LQSFLCLAPSLASAHKMLVLPPICNKKWHMSLSGKIVLGWESVEGLIK
jgi:hypothetical protein